MVRAKWFAYADQNATPRRSVLARVWASSVSRLVVGADARDPVVELQVRRQGQWCRAGAAHPVRTEETGAAHARARARVVRPRQIWMRFAPPAVMTVGTERGHGPEHSRRGLGRGHACASTTSVHPRRQRVAMDARQLLGVLCPCDTSGTRSMAGVDPRNDRRQVSFAFYVPSRSARLRRFARDASSGDS